MDAQWTFYALIFAAVFLAVQGLRGIITARLEDRRIADRFGSVGASHQSRAEVELLKKRGSQVGQRGTLGAIRTLIIQSGTKLDLPKLSIVLLVLSCILYFFTR